MPSFTTPNSDGEDYTRLTEAWSPAARAAAAEARKHRGKGKVVRQEIAGREYRATLRGSKGSMADEARFSSMIGKHSSMANPSSGKLMRSIGQQDARYEREDYLQDRKLTSKRGETPGRRETFAAVRNMTRSVYAGMMSGNASGKYGTQNKVIGRLNKMAKVLAKRKNVSPAYIAKTKKNLARLEKAVVNSFNF